AAWPQQPVVTVNDIAGNLAPDSTAPVSLALAPGAGPATAVLSCAAGTVSAAGGVASFSGCAIAKAGNGYVLSASSGGLAGTVSSAFAIAAGQPAALRFSAQPGGADLGAPFQSQPSVTVQDAFGNTAPVAVPVVLAITPGTGAADATLTCALNPVTTAAGIAGFSGCGVSKAGTGFTLTAGTPNVPNATSLPFSVVATVAPVPTLVIDPITGPPGTLVNVTANGLTRTASGVSITIGSP